MEFKASWGTSTLLVTLLVIVMFLVLAGLQLVPETSVGGAARIIIPVTFIVILLVTWGYSVKKYVINDGWLIIPRPFRDRRFAFSNIRNAEKIDAKDLRFSFRTFGNGGLFGYYGKFTNRKFGNMTWFATNIKNAVLIIMNDGRKIVVTPDEPERFINAIAKKL